MSHFAKVPADSVSRRAPGRNHAVSIELMKKIVDFGDVIGHNRAIPAIAIEGGGTTMNAEELRAAQAPLKARYREQPETAMVTLRAEGRLDTMALTCRVDTARAMVEAGLHPATGGPGSFACSGDMLLEALVGCAGVTLNAVAASLGIPVRGGKVIAEGDLDFRGTLAVSKEAPVGLRSIRLKLELDTDANAEQLATLTKLTEQYCVIYQTLKNPPALEIASQQPERA
jgi:uncharacterized OsmC-like protein